MERLNEADDIFLTTSDLAERWKKSEWWVYTNRKSLGLPGMKLGGEWRFPLQEVRHWERNRI